MPEPQAYARFAEAADALAAENKPTTLRNVLERAGGGSMRDVTTAMRLWRQRKQAIPEVSEVPPAGLLASVEQIWREAYTRATSRVSEERQALAAAVATAEKSVEEATEVADLLESQRDALIQELNEVKRERDIAQKDALEYKAQLDGFRALLEERLDAILPSKARRNRTGK